MGKAFVLGLVLLSAAGLRAQQVSSVLDYDSRPRLAAEFFRGQQRADSGSVFNPQIQYGSTGGDPGNPYAGSFYDARAIAFPYANTLQSGPESALAMAYFEAQWQIVGYHARLLKSRLRRELVPTGVFGRIYDEGYRANAIYAGVEAEWSAALEALALETSQGQDFLRSTAFVNEYRRAVDTVTFPLVALRPHGLEAHFALGSTIPLRDLNPSLSAGFAIDFGMGYTYDRWMALLSVIINTTPLASGADAPAVVVERRTQWNNFGLGVGYRWLRRDKWEAASRVNVLAANLLTGEESQDSDQIRLRRDFALGVAQSVSYLIGRGYRAELDAGRVNGIRAIAVVNYTPQRWIENLRGPVVSVNAGIEITMYGIRYE